MKHPYYGGAEVNIHEQAKIWIKQRHKVTQFSPRFKGAKKEENIDGIRIVRYGGRFTNYIYAPIIYLLKLRKECDIIIDIENGIPYFTPLYSRKPKICIIHHVHQDIFFRELPLIIAWVPLLLEKYGLRLFYKKTKIIAVSHTTRDEAIKKLGIIVIARKQLGSQSVPPTALMKILDGAILPCWISEYPWNTPKITAATPKRIILSLVLEINYLFALFTNIFKVIFKNEI